MKKKSRAFPEQTLRVIDVGASRGEFSEYVARQANVEVVAVEPLDDVAACIPRLPNIAIEVSAIRDVDEPTFENMYRTEFSELSSFLVANESASEQIWAAHLDLLGVISRPTVPVQSLEHLIAKLAWERVDFLKIDAQGTDLEVLESARSRLKDISAAVIEVPYSSDSSLYANEGSLRNAIEWGYEAGFQTMRVVPNGGGEANLFLANSAVGIEKYFEIERRLGLQDCPTLKLSQSKDLIWKEFVRLPRQQFAKVPYLKGAYRTLRRSRAKHTPSTAIAGFQGR